MADREVDIGIFIAVYVVEDGGCYHIRAEHWDEVDAAFHNWVERRIDRVLSVVNTNGSDVLLPASRIGEVLRSTPESRAMSAILSAAMKDEQGFTDD